ncbi:hypothetical protein F5887DRAFT_927127 [Amanita rubescens]|nr:hypothetical protein F5887DRAFT_927127 [Amanita rubescens]
MGKRKANKRRKVVTTAEEVAASVDLKEGWLDKLLELPTDELAKLLKTAAIEMARASLSGVKWIDPAERFSLRNRLENNQFDRVVTPMYRLPPSVHEIVFEAAWHTQDVYQELRAQRSKAARFRTMDPKQTASHDDSICHGKLCLGEIAIEMVAREWVGELFFRPTGQPRLSAWSVVDPMRWEIPYGYGFMPEGPNKGSRAPSSSPKQSTAKRIIVFIARFPLSEIKISAD